LTAAFILGSLRGRPACVTVLLNAARAGAAVLLAVRLTIAPLACDLAEAFAEVAVLRAGRVGVLADVVFFAFGPAAFFVFTTLPDCFFVDFVAMSIFPLRPIGLVIVDACVGDAR
jgi:hypothetical protein